MKPLYKKMNVSDLDLTRNLACSVTLLGPLIPWNMNAVIALDLLGGILFPICALLFPGICHAGSVNRQLSAI